MKPLGSISAYDYIRSQSDIIYGGFVKAGIVEILQTATNEDMDKDPFEDLDTTVEDD